MSDPIIESKGDKLPKVEVPEPLPPSERETYEGKITLLEKEIETLKKQIEELAKPKTEKKKASGFDRFNPLS